MGTSLDNPIERTGFKVTALVLSKLRRSDIDAEYKRLAGATRPEAWLQVGAVMVGLFALACIAAYFGWIGLAVYFAAIVLIFR